uniref:Glucose-6-phosphatase 3 n=1 Tax=Eptatretus burgeri TaxID=7764 RepID=A0A8C4NH25_EPTBU
MQALYVHGVSCAAVLQKLGTLVGGLEHGLVFASHLGDPRVAFRFVFPVALVLFSPALGHAVLRCAIISEWLNVVFKWFLFGERPYWWIFESGFYLEKDPEIQQFSVTCETGPGSPSGHCMVTAAVMWVMVPSLENYVYNLCRSRWMARTFTWGPALLFLMAIGISRVFILAHFPHQVIAGLVAGACLGWLLRREKLTQGWDVRAYIIASLSLICIALIFQYGLLTLGLDLHWSLRLAQRWCTQKKWVHLITTPLSSLMRDSGACCGLGIALHVFGALRPTQEGPFMRAVSAVLILLALHLLDSLKIPSDPLLLFYALIFLKNTALPIVVMGIFRFFV